MIYFLIFGGFAWYMITNILKIGELKNSSFNISRQSKIIFNTSEPDQVFPINIYQNITMNDIQVSMYCHEFFNYTKDSRGAEKLP